MRVGGQSLYDYVQWSATERWQSLDRHFGRGPSKTNETDLVFLCGLDLVSLAI